MFLSGQLRETASLESLAIWSAGIAGIYTAAARLAGLAFPAKAKDCMMPVDD